MTPDPDAPIEQPVVLPFPTSPIERRASGPRRLRADRRQSGVASAAAPGSGGAGTEARLSRDLLVHLLAEGAVTTAYQPILDLGAGRIIGWEALVRAEHPLVGVVAPVTLVDSALMHGLLDEVTRAVVEDAWRTMTLARELVEGPLTIHLNLELDQLCEDTPLLGWLSALQWPAEVKVTVEITERGGDSWLPRHEAAAHALTDGGLALAIDDYGAGSARMAFLHRRHWDVVKLDRQLVEVSGERQRLVLGHLVRMLTSLGTESVAEGIETHEQLAAVRSLGADAAQGYLLGVPVPASVMLTGLAERGLELHLA